MRFAAVVHDHVTRARCLTRAVPLLTPMVVLVLAACGTDTGDADGNTFHMTVEDSAGVRIVEYTGTPTADAPVAFAPKPIYRHGTGPDDYLFSQIRHGVLLGDGSAAVFDAVNNEVVLLDPDGTSQSVLASRGQGPGDVGSVGAMFALGRDSLLLEDDDNSRLSLFVGGSPDHTTWIPADVSYALDAHGIDADGRILMSSSGYRGGFPEEWLRGHMVRFDPETGVVDTVATYDFVPFVPPEGAPLSPFRHAGMVAGVSGEHLYGRNDSPQLVWRRTDGSVRQIVRWEAEWVYPTDEHWEVIANSERESVRLNLHAMTDEEQADRVARRLSRYEVKPDQPLPLFEDPFGDDEDRVWLPEYGIWGGPPPSSYTLFSSDGEWLGRVAVPEGVQVLDVAGGRALGITRDEMSVESLVVYELVGR